MPHEDADLKKARKKLLVRSLLAALLPASMGGCIGGFGDDSAASSDARRQFPLHTLTTSEVTINDHVFRTWVVGTSAQVSEGLMFVHESEIADDQGMLFVFPDEAVRGFWMKNTITPLDIAFARFDGTITAIHTMPPLTLRIFSSIEPAMFALEVKAGTFERLEIAEGDRIRVPQDVFKVLP